MGSLRWVTLASPTGLKCELSLPLRFPCPPCPTVPLGERPNLAHRPQSRPALPPPCSGILLGTLVQGVLIVETVLVPAQKGSADTCVTTNEDQIWEYCDAHELMTLGWIHTHPSQVGCRMRGTWFGRFVWLPPHGCRFELVVWG
jgi:hypothetical protein